MIFVSQDHTIKLQTQIIFFCEQVMGSKNKQILYKLHVPDFRHYALVV